VIEDNPTNLQLMVYLLRAFGHEALEAHEGAEGVEKARRERPDLILLDIHMPRMDGYEVARLLRKDSECSRIPIVAVTALAMVGDREKILASGFSGYIAKPLDPEMFPSQIQGFLGAAHPASARPPVQLQQKDLPARTSPRKRLAVVLFVDNLQTNIDLVRSVLEPSGYEVVAALSAKEGLGLAQRTKPDLIISDVHMPHQDGYEFMRMVQADPELSGIPFVFLSSSVWSTQEQQHALMQGAKKFISRPIEPQMLLEKLKDCIPKLTKMG
jgi:two-component system cell cycle response regulator